MAKKNSENTWLWALGAGVAIAALAAWRRKDLVTLADTISDGIRGAAQAALDSANAMFFELALPSAAQPYADLIRRVAADTGLDPFLVYGIGQTESAWGAALSPRGPGGTGDGGHGHGIMQIDDRTWGAWLASNDWTDPETNVRKGVAILQSNLDFFSGSGTVKGITDGAVVTLSSSAAAKRGVAPGAYTDPRPLDGDQLTAAAIAAYNTGAANVLMSLAAGLPAETTTTGGTYFSTVFDHLSDAASSFVASLTGGGSSSSDS